VNYGPLATALERITNHLLHRPKASDYEACVTWDRVRRQLAYEFQNAQDKFYDDVKSGRLVKEGE